MSAILHLTHSPISVFATLIRNSTHIRQAKWQIDNDKKQQRTLREKKKQHIHTTTTTMQLVSPYVLSKDFLTQQFISCFFSITPISM